MTAHIQDPLNPTASLEVVAVSCELNHLGGLHVGFLYQREDGTYWFTDMAWELLLRNEQTNCRGKCWINVKLAAQNLELLAAALEEIPAQRVPYDVRYDSEKPYFDSITRAYLNESPGLTCATYILGVLRGFQLELFDVANWPGRPEDGPDIEKLIVALEKHGVPSDRIAAMRANHGNMRFRPQEVCGAVAETAWPVMFHLAERLGCDVAEHFASQ
jgi:hypothetical protein